MKASLWIACLLAVPVPAQMQMPMGDMPSAPVSASSHEAHHASRTATHAVPQPPAMPFGGLADADTSAGTRPAAAVPTPVALGTEVQEQEHPERRNGSEAMPFPDLLAEVRLRASKPLQFFAERAAAANPTLREAEAQVRRLRAEARQAGLWQNPEIGYEADHVRGGSYAGGEQGGYVQQTIPIAGQRSAAKQSVQAQAQAAEAVLAEQRQRVEAAVEQAFYAALVAQRKVELREALAALASDNAVAAHQFANIGQADAPDVLGSEVEREQARLELASAQRSFLKAYALLATVSGQAAFPASPLTGDLTAVPVLGDGAAMDAVERSPTVAVAQQQAAASDAAVRSAQKQAGPQLTLKGGLQQDNEPLDASLRRVGVVGVAQAGLTLPLWNRNQGAVEAARAQQASAAAEVERTRLTLHLAAEQARQDYATAMSQAQAYRDALLPRAQRAADLYEQKYAAMAAAYPQRVAARRMLLQLQLEYTGALGEAWHNAVLLQHGLLQDGLAAPTAMRAEMGVAPTDSR